MNTPFHVIIPARYQSVRLPGKPLRDIAGKSMIQRVYEQACRSGATQVVIATDDQRIVEAAQTFGAPVCLTSSRHPSGTDRLQEAAAQLQLQDDDIVVNVQGDEPLIPPAIIDQVARNLARHPRASISTLYAPCQDAQTMFNPNAIKVVTDTHGYALYFSRAPIPWVREHFDAPQPTLPADMTFKRHIGIYGYRAGFLQRYVQWPSAPIERWESLEQLRAMWNGEVIHVEEAVEIPRGGVDTPEDLERVQNWIISNQANSDS
ncbi:3-deoxy-manno-octulosonate cytidylyltransferase [Desulfurispira natronophila]|uniref:3-deoxy-manno-octulosonate cytidylyltransferase n=1 Tax=Desulfurispira natronophila TaxID=682562 RepID=A0A7W7Y4V1_9BACT|nr:3-deoxy-manno-octulosonate cytidylyltransferase (CMP-KDO synthetase) [Desulfurispira natronophila]